MKQLKDSEARCLQLQKTVKSYESAVEKLTKRHKQAKREQKAKNAIVEQYL